MRLNLRVRSSWVDVNSHLEKAYYVYYLCVCDMRYKNYDEHLLLHHETLILIKVLNVLKLQL